MSRRLQVLKNNRLHIQLLLLFILATVLLMTAGSYIIYRNMADTLRERNEQLVLQQFSQVEQNMANLYGEVDRLMDIFLEGDDVQRYFQSGRYLFVYPDVKQVTGIYAEIKQILLYYDFIDSIYLFTGENESIGASRRNTHIGDGNERVHPFFGTEAFKTAYSATGPSRWYGSFTAWYFNDLTRILPQPDTRFISHVKTVNTSKAPSRRGVLVCNISEDYVRTLYGALSVTPGDSLFLADAGGQIVSAVAPGGPESGGTLMENTDPKAGYGSVTLSGENGMSQLIYYRLSPINWTIMREIPLTADMESVFSTQLTFILVIAALSVLAVFALSFFWFRRILSPLRRLTWKMQEMGKGNLDLETEKVPRNEIGIVSGKFNEMVRSLNGLMRDNERIEREKRLLEIEALQAQLNPHFLYNTLNMIKWMAAAIKADNIVNSLVALGNILRPVFRNAEVLWALSEELGYLSNYVKIMNWRHNNSVFFTADVEEGCQERAVPRFILQPLVENAVVHGLDESNGGLGITLKSGLSGDGLIITVTDNGAGIDPETLAGLNDLISSRTGGTTSPEEGQKIGIANVARRLRLHCGEDGKLLIKSPAAGGCGTEVTIVIGSIKNNSEIEKL
ncbi:MAG: sensor histidine kinase [Firmicutes bacterium]|nr:sensor histidine kinase [Bacillota bacterium]